MLFNNSLAALEIGGFGMWNCRNCQKENKDDRKDCWHCSTPKGMIKDETLATPSQETILKAQNITNQTPTSLSNRESNLLHRYTDAYLIANVIISIGSLIKTVGIVFAVLIFLTSFGLGAYATGNNGGSNGNQNGLATGFLLILFGGAIFACIVGFIYYVIGVIVSANGQVLKATLDNTVGNSPFLTSNLKARIMSLPEE